MIRRSGNRQEHYCQRCGIEFTCYDGWEPDFCDDCIEDLEAEESEFDEYVSDLDEDELSASDWADDWPE